MKSLVFFICLFFLSIAQSQSVFIKGRVINGNKKPLEGVNIFIKELEKGTSSDSDGNFKIKVPRGNYLFNISFVGYKTTQKIISTRDTKNIFTLYKDNNILDEVLVSSVRAKNNAPITYNNLTKKEISKRNLGQDIPLLLKFLPSITSSSDAGAGVGYTYLRVRGSDASRVNVTINGIPYNDAESQGTFWVNMGDFASSIQSLQLQRGVGTSTNGSGAFAASLNILTNYISNDVGAEISNSFGSFKTRKHTLKFTTGKINKYFELSGRLSNIYSDGYVDRAFTDLKSYFLQANYVNNKTLIKALAFGGKEKTYQAWYGVSKKQLKENRKYNHYTYDNETDNYWQDHYQFHWNQKLNKFWSINLGLNYTKGKGFFEQFKPNSAVSKYNGIVKETSKTWDGKPATDLIVRRWLNNDFYVSNFNSTYKNKAIEIISGVSLSKYTSDHYGEVIWSKGLANKSNIRDRYYLSDAIKNDYNFFTKINYKLNKSLLSYVDFQGRYIGYKTKGLTSDRNTLNIDKKFIFFNPKIGFTYLINNKNSLYFSYARANKEPNRNDFKNGKNVKPETLNDFELGWRLKNKNLKFNTNLYYMLYNNQLIETGGLNDVGSYLRKNIKDSYRLGVEIDVNFILSNKFTINYNLTLSQNKIKNFILTRDNISKNIGTTNIAFSPNIITSNSFIYQPFEKLQLVFLSKYVDDQYLSNTDTKESKISNYFISDFNFIYHINTKSIFKSIVINGVVNNLFNSKYVDRGYTYLNIWTNPGKPFEVQGYYPQATRNFLIGLTFKF